MLKFVSAASVLLGLVSIVPSAEAHYWHHRYEGQFRLGYHRWGPPYGYKFGFATYAGDPFASDDYFDGHRCYYLHRHDFCRGPRTWGWPR
jgi:hypothetical protein